MSDSAANSTTGSIRASVVITTRNRKADLAVAVRSAAAQSAPVEVLVVDDGSTDGTGELIAREFPPDRFPAVRYVRCETSEGYIAQRNRGARLAAAPYLFSIDDDAEFASARTVEQTLAEFDHPRVAAVAIPFINVRQHDVVWQRTPDPGRRWVFAEYIGTAHALRRDVFLSLGGYRAELVHQGEEEDLCARLFDAGFVVRAGSADPIHHYESPNRDRSRMTYYGQRNLILYCWQNVPLPHLLARLPGSALRGLAFSARIGKLPLAVRGQASGVGQILAGGAPRRPIRRDIYRLIRMLHRRGGRPLDEIEPLLPPGPLAGVAGAERSPDDERPR